MGVFLLLEGGTGFVDGVYDFKRKALFVWHTTLSAGSLYQPHKGIVLLPVTLDWEWNLVVCTTNAATLYFKARADILDALFKYFKWLFGL